jgi:hypothetical protein
MLSEERSLLLTIVALVSLHGIYSVSFLEIWSLAQGSYSMSVLSGIKDKKSILRKDLVDSFSEIGDAKKNNRLAALIELGLVCQEKNKFSLTKKGKVIALILRFFHWVPNLKNTG